ncbi:MAG: hypothetical protein HC777_02795 [Hyphomonadaceae bacterium]|nr:hypothetical protein [Hyphomonadaceae bacterium]
MARDHLAQSGLEHFLQQQGVDTAIDVENLQFGSATLRDVTLGPARNPTLRAQSVKLNWRYERGSGLWVIEAADIVGLTARLELSRDGQLDFGALNPLIKPQSGPKRVRIDALRLNDANLTLVTPLGDVRSIVSVTGSEAGGWTGVGRIGLAPCPNARGANRDGAVSFWLCRAHWANGNWLKASFQRYWSGN